MVDSFHHHLNSIHPNIQLQFTVEKESDGQLPNSWTSTWHGMRMAPSSPRCTARPPTQINIWVSSLMHHPAAYKRAVINTRYTEPRPSRHQEWARLPESLRRMLTPLAILVTFCSFRTLRQLELVHLKDPVPADRRKDVVYTTSWMPIVPIRTLGRQADP